MGLQNEFAAKMRLVIDQDRAHTYLTELDCRGKARRTASDDQYIRVIFGGRSSCMPILWWYIRQFWKAFSWKNPHIALDGRHACFDWERIGNHHALRALPVGAKNPLGGVIFGVMAEDGNAIRHEGGGNHFTFLRQEGLVLPIKRNVCYRIIDQNWVSLDTILSHKLLKFANSGVYDTTNKASVEDLLVFLVQFVIAQMRVALGDSDVGVARQHLRKFEIAGAAEDRGDEIVAERVGSDSPDGFFAEGFLHALIDNFPPGGG